MHARFISLKPEELDVMLRPITAAARRYYHVPMPKKGGEAYENVRRGLACTAPFLARPYVDVTDDTAYAHYDGVPQSALQSSRPVWMLKENEQYAYTLFREQLTTDRVIHVNNLHQLPQPRFPQVAIVGRSNVGKSTLLNALIHGHCAQSGTEVPSGLGKRQTPLVSPVSTKPGKTRVLYTYHLGKYLSIVDLPGYGETRGISKTMKLDWGRMVEHYLTASRSLSRVVCLIDPMEGVQKDDLCMLNLLVAKKRNFMLVLTKVDSLKPQRLHEHMERLVALAHDYVNTEHFWPFIHAVSGTQMLGVHELRCSLAVLAKEHGVRKGHPQRKTAPQVCRVVLSDKGAVCSAPQPFE